ncbi:hypothetical protein D3C86_1731660 [compost metagenome]
MLDSPLMRKVSFEDWWDKIVFVDQHQSRFSRKDIVLTVANQDGGAHVDPSLDESYIRLAKENSLGWKLSVGSSEKDLNNGPVYPSIRSIANELLATLRDICPELFPLSDR